MQVETQEEKICKVQMTGFAPIYYSIQVDFHTLWPMLINHLEVNTELLFNKPSILIKGLFFKGNIEDVPLQKNRHQRVNQ